jgi:hypothetical protein
MGFNLDPSYIDVATRIVEFRTKHPEGSLQPADPARPFTVETIDGKQAFVVVAAAYRSPDDQRPGIGMAYESVPGSTSFTRGSELQNAETAAWGRAIVAALAADTKTGVASSEEVRNRQAEQSQPRQQGQAAPNLAQQAEQSLKAAEGDVEKLTSLRAWANQSGAPDAFKARVTAAIEALTPPLEGVVQP